jgi:hypothetical protein
MYMYHFQEPTQKLMEPFLANLFLVKSHQAGFTD